MSLGFAGYAFLVTVLGTSTFCQAAISEKSEASSRLVSLAATQFANLTHAKRAFSHMSKSRISTARVSGRSAGAAPTLAIRATPLPTGDPTAQLSPLLYSLDIFLPFVNLHQEHYWWPDAQANGDCTIAGHCFRLNGSFVLCYLVAADHRGMALERDLFGKCHRPDPK